MAAMKQLSARTRRFPRATLSPSATARRSTVAPGATLAVKGGVTFEVTGKLEVAEGGALAFYSGAKIDLSTVTGDVTFPEMGTGTGTADDPYTISTADGLRALAGIVDNGYDFAGKTVVLDEDIDLKGDDSNQWNPIGSYGSGGTNKLPFNGAFDGGGKHDQAGCISTLGNPLPDCSPISVRTATYRTLLFQAR